MSNNNFRVGDEVYFVSSSIFVRKATIIRITRDFFTIKFEDTGGGTRVRKSKIYLRKEEAEAVAAKNKRFSV